jgi:YfiH family protein
VLTYDEDADGARFAFTDRYGGVSTGPYMELNLGGHVGDDAAAVVANRRRVAERIGMPAGQVLYMNQVHGADVAVVDGPWEGRAPDVDAMITSRPGVVLAVLVADCVPVLLADRTAGVVGVAHAGRPGLAAGVVPAILAAMHERGAGEIRARIGPSVCGRCYEVPDAMRAEVAAQVPQSWAVTRRGTPALDVAAGVEAQLRSGGAVDVVRSDACTVEDLSLYSYRRDRTTGRQAGLVWLSGPAR